MTSPILWIAGVSWDDVPGTDKRLVIALADRSPVIWVDAPARGHWRGWLSRSWPSVSEVHPGVTRVRAPAPPGFSRRPVRALTALVQQWTVRRNLPVAPAAIVVANPVIGFPRGVDGTKVLFVTDDWVAGAPLMGYSATWLTGVLAANVREADAISAVTPALLEMVHALGASEGASAVIPNGAPEVQRVGSGRPQPVAGIVGQLNARLDLSMLEAVADAGIRLRLIGPRVDGDEAFARRLDGLIARENVEWTGRVSPEELPSHFADLAVGLTPYEDSEFNRASFPLKTLEYLAAGLPVVSTDLPASRWLATDHMTIATDADAFVDAVRSRIADVEGGAEPAAIVDERVAFAVSHGWPRRAESLRELIAAGSGGTA